VTARRGIIGAALTGVVVAGGGFVLTGTADAATTTETSRFYSTDDAYTSSTRRTVNFGAADKLVVGKKSGETRLSYVKFAAKVAPGRTVTAARLRLPVEGKPVAATLRVYSVRSSWSEKTLTAAHAPALGRLVGSVKPKATDTTLTFDVSTVVTKAGTYAFALRSSATRGVTRLRSIEYGARTKGGPELVLTLKRNKATTKPTKPATSAPAQCMTGALLVPSCGVLWGAAAGGFTDVPRDQALKNWEAQTGRTATIFHAYHRGDERFPTKSEIAMTQDPAHPRVLLLNWKVAHNSTWADVAAGHEDARIDMWSAYVKQNYSQKFFLALHHEPENDVRTAASSGMTAKDYAAMYRHVVTRLRANGVTNAVNVIAYMGNEKWMAQSWWKDLYPGDAYVDWVGLDSYVSVEKDYYHYGDMGDLLDRQPSGGGLGWYDWAVKNHPAKPIMVAEWGMYHRRNRITDKSAAFNSVIPALKEHPAVKAIVYFDTPSDNEGDRDISVNSSGSSLASFRKVAADPMFTVTVRQ
jgi:beta-mannanase